jgi:hypothetical protein
MRAVLPSPRRRFKPTLEVLENATAASRGARNLVVMPAGIHSRAVARLVAPRLSAKSGITFAAGDKRRMPNDPRGIGSRAIYAEGANFSPPTL